jgi:hypothetical protein
MNDLIAQEIINKKREETDRILTKLVQMFTGVECSIFYLSADSNHLVVIGNRSKYIQGPLYQINGNNGCAFDKWLRAGSGYQQWAFNSREKAALEFCERWVEWGMAGQQSAEQRLEELERRYPDEPVCENPEDASY